MLRDYQQYAINQIFNYLNTTTGNGVVCMPTGVGKSHVISGTIEQGMAWRYNTRWMILTNVKELIQQNFNKLIDAWPHAPAGIYSAGLGRKEALPITFGGIQSAVNNPELFGFIDLLFIDECQFLNPQADGLYMQFIKALKVKNPNLRVIGLTATPWRMGMGHIVDGTIFHHVICDMTGLDAFNWFIDQGYIVRLVARPTETKLDLSGVSISKGDFAQGQLQKAVDHAETTSRALYEACYWGQNRRAWLVFASGIEHAQHISDELNRMGVKSTYVHSNLDKEFGKGERDKRIAAFRRGEYRAIVNYGILTTGFDDPRIDMIIMLRPTLSVPLWVQMLGRGTRTDYYLGNYPRSILDTVEGRLWAIQNSQKHDCLVLDFARNTQRLGPINDPLIPRKKGEGTGEVPIKLCAIGKMKNPASGCGTMNHTRNKYCDGCHAEFDFTVKITQVAGTEDLIVSDQPIIDLLPVNNVFYSKHTAPSGNVSLRVDYYSGKKRYTEFVALENDHKFIQKKAEAWWLTRFKLTGVPPTVDAALPYANRTYLREPTAIRVWTNKKPYPEIVGYEYE
jgi:DNA repair protein RadD